MHMFLHVGIWLLELVWVKPWPRKVGAEMEIQRKERHGWTSNFEEAWI